MGSMLSKYFFIFLIFFVLLHFSSVLAETSGISATLFYDPSCAASQQMIIYLADLQSRYPEIRVSSYDIVQPENLSYSKKMSREYHFDIGQVPIVIVGQSSFVGFSEASKTGIEQEIRKELYQTTTNYPRQASLGQLTRIIQFIVAIIILCAAIFWWRKHFASGGNTQS